MHLSAGGAAACFKDFWAGKTDAVNWNRAGIDAVHARLSVPSFNDME
jgi:hypothetical protein